MNLNTRFACLALIIAVFLVGCGGATATSETVDTVAVPSASPASPSPSATAPPASPTTQPPTVTQSPPKPTFTPPTDTPPPPAASETLVSSPVPTQANLPVEGVWAGGGSNLLLNFEVQTSASQATISNVGILWEGRDECELNVRLKVSVLVEASGFELTYQADEFSLVMTGAPTSSSLFTGALKFHVDGCGDHKVSWQAVPKTSAGQ
jgi:hypothetical protein